MRIGTWNLAGRWSPEHERYLLDLDCDVLLLTEVSERLELPGYRLHRGTALMAPRRRWAAVASRAALTSLPDPHPASAMAVTEGWTFCSSILPWRSCGAGFPWEGLRHVDKTEASIQALLPHMPTNDLVWGGDWNHALSGREWSGSIGGREAVLAAVEKLDLQVPTADLPHRIDGLLSIDHIGVPRSAVASASAHSAAAEDDRLSDHDAYTIELKTDPEGPPGR